MIATWNELLQQEGVNFNLTHFNQMWDLVENELGSGSWTVVEQISLSRYANDLVGATWTTNAVRWLIQAVLGYQHAFGPAAPTPVLIPPPAPATLYTPPRVLVDSLWTPGLLRTPQDSL